MKRFLTVLVVLAVLAGIGASVYYFFNKPVQMEPQASQQPSVQEAKSETPATALIIGKADAPITIVEYGDFQCPICKRFFTQTEPTLKKEYIDTGKAKIEFRIETHLGEESIAAGAAAYCANDQGKFSAYHDELYRNQSGVNSGAFSSANLKAMAKAVGLDQSKFDECVDTNKYRQVVIDSNEEAKRAGVTSTPTFIIGEKKIVGAQPIGVFRPVLQ